MAAGPGPLPDLELRARARRGCGGCGSSGSGSGSGGDASGQVSETQGAQAPRGDAGWRGSGGPGWEEARHGAVSL